MSLPSALFCSSIGRKFLMAITGLILVGFVIGHLVGNLQVFSHPDQINGYAEFLHSLGPLLWVARIGLLVAVAIHIWAAVSLTLENRAARGHQPYAVNRWLKAAFASRYMRLTGVVVLAFLIYHLAHFTIGLPGDAKFKDNLPEYTMAGDYAVAGFPVVDAGASVADVHTMVVLGFQNPLVSLFYIIAVGLLTLHLLHGVESLFQTFGWNNRSWGPTLHRVNLLFCIGYFLGNLAIPAAILAGQVGLHPAAQTALAAAGLR